MTRAEQIRRFGSVIQPVEAPEVVLGAAGGKRFSRRKMPPAPFPDCHLAKAARRHARWRLLRRSVINLAHGACMGALLVGALAVGAYLGG